MTRLQQRKQEVEVSKKNLDAQFKNLERLDFKKSHAELMGRMI